MRILGYLVLLGGFTALLIYQYHNIGFNLSYDPQADCYHSQPCKEFEGE